MNYTLGTVSAIALGYILLVSPPSACGQDSGDEILKRLRDFDSVYLSGFTISGTSPGPFKKKWKITTSDGRIAYEEEVVEVLALKNKGQFVPLRRVCFVGPKAHAQYDFVGRVHEVGELPPWPENSPGLATAGCLDIAVPEAPTYKLPIKKVLWSLGRGYSEHITAITNVKPRDDGLLLVTAEGTDVSNRPGARWEMVIDPKAAYMVRQAELYRGAEQTAFLSIVNSGTKWVGARCVPERTQLKAPFEGTRAFEHQHETASDRTDQEFLRHAELTMNRPYLVHTDVHDHRMSPELYLAYNAGELFPQGSKGQELDIGLDALAPDEQPDDLNSLAGQTPPATQPAELQNPALESNSAPNTPTVVTDRVADSVRASQIKRNVAWVVLALSVVIGIGYLAFHFARR